MRGRWHLSGSGPCFDVWPQIASTDTSEVDATSGAISAGCSSCRAADVPSVPVAPSRATPVPPPIVLLLTHGATFRRLLMVRIGRDRRVMRLRAACRFHCRIGEIPHHRSPQRCDDPLPDLSRSFPAEAGVAAPDGGRDRCQRTLCGRGWPVGRAPRSTADDYRLVTGQRAPHIPGHPIRGMRQPQQRYASSTVAV